MSKQFEHEPWRAVRDAKGRIMHYTNGFTGLGGDYVDDLVIETTHLTDAECAAEYWRAGHMAQSLFHATHRGNETGWTEWDRNCEIWHRFATHPHAHDED